MKLALGPIQYYWPRDAVFRFYKSIAATPVDIVYLGETVCSRRHELRLADWTNIAEKLRDAGKEVILSTQVLLESKSDVTVLKAITGNGGFLVEANDFGAVRLLADVAPFIAGSQLNIYNAQTLQLMAKLGARRWVVPLETSRQSLACVLEDKVQIETELFAYGRMPLAYSARCFTARHHNLPKDDCQFKCLEYPDGLLMKTRESEHFLTLNGIQTQSALVYNLVREMDAFRELGVGVLRISPQANHTDEIVTLFHAAMNGEKTVSKALADMEALAPDRFCDGYWHGQPGLNQIAA
ncbi:U32 family peptidase [Noviherbaspirillum sp. Root189]|uniref:U32 family peptidase n=1 Tax=Noviherbaspirillum sp. Root189 TaxID=1736487 RepID=UPI0007153BC6|nr:U32 family peptidase [Noviherbaspirillum sp. Root189]KRB93052.1 protease [Noviherbaspirillum sp. Root189]